MKEKQLYFLHFSNDKKFINNNFTKKHKETLEKIFKKHKI